ncbi:MAG TPA: hypothetical protein VJQ60_15005, partial [Arthrobacter sp.]|nr:hypothetical protein [Arthrobacter sp.]
MWNVRGLAMGSAILVAGLMAGCAPTATPGPAGSTAVLSPPSPATTQAAPAAPASSAGSGPT